MTPDLQLEHKRRTEFETEKSQLRAEQNKQLTDAQDADRLFQTILNVLGIAVRCYPKQNARVLWGREELYFTMEGTSNLICYYEPRCYWDGKHHPAGTVKSFFFANVREVENFVNLVQEFIKEHKAEIEAGKKLHEIDTGNTRRGFRDP